MGNINWFPGHMTKALRLIEENLKKTDAVIYVLDCRAVSACINPLFKKMTGSKPVVYCFNKKDTVLPADLKLWTECFDSLKLPYVVSDSLSGKDSARVLQKLKEAVGDKLEKYALKGVRASVRAMVIGIPNSGKSALINSLCRGKKTVTGDRPGVTRQAQWLSVEKGIDLLDTPGTLWPRLDNQVIARDLAFLGSIGADALDISDIAQKFLSFMSESAPQLILERYKIQGFAQTPLDTLNNIALSRGYVQRGGEPDLERAASAIVDDFRKQRIGKIMLEKPTDGTFEI